MKTEIVVIGAGPAGLLAAEEAARRGKEVLVLEEHRQIGVPNHCAGLLSVSGLRSLGLKPPLDVIQNEVTGARIYSPSGHNIVIHRGEREAVVVDRALFDQWLAVRASQQGVTIRTDSHVLSTVARSDGRIVRTRNQNDVYARVVIDGEGVRGVLVRQAGLPPVDRRHRLPAFQYELRGVEVNEDLVEMFYTNRFAPGFFAWIIPLDDGRARVGLAARDRARQRLDAAINHHTVMRERLSRARVEKRMGGVVVTGTPIPRTYAPGLLVVGDAAGHVKATTGGGVIVGGGAARIAGRVAAQAVERGDCSTRLLQRYEKLWRAEYLFDLRAMRLAQRTIASLTDRGLDTLISETRKHGLVEIVHRVGDMDRQGRVLVNLARSPRAVAAVLKAFCHINLALF